MLLTGELELAAEDVRRSVEGRPDVTALEVGRRALEGLGRDGVLDVDDRGQGLVVDLDGDRPEAGRLEGVAEHPRDGVPEVHDLAGEEWLVVLDTGVVDAGHGVGREHPHDPRHGQGRSGAQPGHPGVRMGRLDRVGVQDVARAQGQIVGVEGGAGHVQGCRLVRYPLSDDSTRGTLGQVAHADTPSAVGPP